MLTPVFCLPTFLRNPFLNKPRVFFCQVSTPLKPRQPIGAQGNQMGDNLTAINLGTGASASQVVCGSGFTCALLSGSNSVKCWGRNHYGYLALDSRWSVFGGIHWGFFTIFVKSVEDGPLLVGNGVKKPPLKIAFFHGCFHHPWNLYKDGPLL